MADIKKFLDQAGVSTLWSKIAEELEAKQTAINAVDEKVTTNAGKITILEGKVEALEEGTYDDTEIRGLISTNADAIAANTEAIGVLNGDAETAGSVANTATAIVATKIAEVVAGADASFDTLKEIADWILNDTTGAANMANKIATLEGLVGDVAVATQIANAIEEALKVDGVDKYALASDLNDLVARVKTLEDAGYMNETAVNAAIDSKITALKLAETYEAKGTAEDLLQTFVVYRLNDFHNNQTLINYLSKFNISPLDSNGEFKSTETLLKEISKTWEFLTSEEQKTMTSLLLN